MTVVQNFHSNTLRKQASVHNHRLSHGAVGWSAIASKWPENTIKDYHMVQAEAILTA